MLFNAIYSFSFVPSYEELCLLIVHLNKDLHSYNDDGREKEVCEREYCSRGEVLQRSCRFGVKNSLRVVSCCVRVRRD